MNKPENNKQGFSVSRRNFLKAGAAVAATAGLVAGQTMNPTVAKAAMESQYVTSDVGMNSKLRPKKEYGGAKVKFALDNEEWLGTTKIVGEVKSIKEGEAGFGRAKRGLLGDEAFRGVTNFIPKHPIGGAISGMRPFISSPEAVEGTGPAAEKLPIPDPEQMSMHIKDLAYFLHADEVGIGNMRDSFYYTHKDVKTPEGQIDVPYTERNPYVIVVMIDQGLETMLASTGYDGISGSQSMNAYLNTGVLACIIADYIRRMGYEARAHHSNNYGAVMVPCIMAAGLGELCRTADCAIHPYLGFRHKVAAVTTNLPLAPDKPIDFGLMDFCRVCKKCADECPSGAITHDVDPVEHNGYMRWNSDSDKCTVFRTTNEEGSSCGRCMKVCPWNSKEDSWFHKAGLWIGSSGEGPSKLLKGIDDIFGYGTEELEKYKWWIEWPELYKIPEA